MERARSRGLVRSVARGRRRGQPEGTSGPRRSRVEEVRATGGVFRSDLWRDVVAGVLNRPLVVTGSAEGSGLGAAILGAKALGIVDTLQEGYDLLRGESIEEHVRVSASDLETYEAHRYRVGTLLQRYGRLGADLR